MGLLGMRLGRQATTGGDLHSLPRHARPGRSSRAASPLSFRVAISCLPTWDVAIGRLRPCGLSAAAEEGERRQRCKAMRDMRPRGSSLEHVGCVGYSSVELTASVRYPATAGGAPTLGCNPRHCGAAHLAHSLQSRGGSIMSEVSIAAQHAQSHCTPPAINSAAHACQHFVCRQSSVTGR